jgi:gluconolactonase
LAGVLAFYGFYLLKTFVFKEVESLLPQYCAAFTMLCLSWAFMGLALQVCLAQGWMPSWLQYGVVFLDLVFVTVLLALAGDPQSPLLVLYFLVLASTPMRGSLRLVTAATAGAVIAYLGLLAYYIYVEIGAHEYAGNPVVKVPRGLQIFLVVALLGAGFLAGQAVRWVRSVGRLAKDEAGRDDHTDQPKPMDSRVLGLGLVLLLLLIPFSVLASVVPISKDSEGIFAPGARLKLEAPFVGGEGPAWHPELGLLSSCPGGIWQTDRTGQYRSYRSDLQTCGLLFDAEGRLLLCEGRRISRLGTDGRLTILTERYQGKRYNTPNDLTIDRQGRIYFSDPRYGDRADMELVDENGKTVEGVYRIDPDGTVTRIIGRELERPNGLLVSADDCFLYVADANIDVGGARKLWRFDLRPDGTVDLVQRKLIFDWGRGRGADGLKQDQKGRLYVAAGLSLPAPAMPDRHLKGGIYVFSADGELLDFLYVPRDLVSNLAFGGDDLRTLYITAGGSLYSIRTTTPGRVVWPSAL